MSASLEQAGGKAMSDHEERLDLRTIAYNAALEIRYAIAASGVDPIQHIPEVDAIIERRLADARRQAFIEASEIADRLEDIEACTDERSIGASQALGEIAGALRAKAEELKP